MLFMISTCIWTHILPCIVWSKAHLTTYVSVNAVVHVNHWVLWMPCTWIRLSRKNGVFAEFVICHPSCFVTCGSWDHKKPPVPMPMTAWLNPFPWRWQLGLKYVLQKDECVIEVRTELLSLPTDRTSHVLFGFFSLISRSKTAKKSTHSWPSTLYESGSRAANQ